MIYDFFSNIKYWLFKYKRYLIALYYQPKLFHRCRACWWVQASLSVPSLASRKRKLFISLLIAVVLTSDSGPLLLVCMFCCWWNQILNPGASSTSSRWREEQILSSDRSSTTSVKKWMVCQNKSRKQNKHGSKTKRRIGRSKLSWRRKLSVCFAKMEKSEHKLVW